MRISVDDQWYEVPDGITVAAALARCGITSLRTSVGGEPRGAFCGMGICFECRVTIGERQHVRSCQIAVAEGMSIRTR